MVDTGGLTPASRAAAPTSLHPKFGPVWATSHLGSEHDLVHRHRPGKAHAIRPGRSCRRVTGQGGGSLFIKTHPKSNNLCVDTPLNPDAEIAASVAVFDIKDLAKESRVQGAADRPNGPASRKARAASYRASTTRTATRVWFSVWNAKDQESAIVVVDDKTRR